MSAISAVNVVKRFRHLAIPKHSTLKEALIKRLWGGSLERKNVEAVSGVSFSVKKGQVLGVVGRNGSGKTTLLRLLGGVYPPDEGQITINGSLAPLLALGAGFHPDLTGRESARIELLVLGFLPRQIDERMEKILEFADIGDFIDAPVRTYSSGMMMRLAFAAAVSVDPDILLLDEVLAVGDAAFAEKCIRCIDDFRARGKTIVLVTHNSAMIREKCDVVLWLDRGKAVAFGDPAAVTGAYDRGATDYAEILRAIERPPAKTLVVYGNCQAEALARLMEKNSLIASSFKVVYYRSYDIPGQTRTPVSPEHLESCALFFSQYDPQPFPDLDRLPRECLKVHFPSMDVNLLWPFHCVNPYNQATPDFPFGPFPYGDRVILECVAKGMSAAETLDYYLTGWEHYKPNLGALGRLERSRLEARDGHCDVKMGSFILDQLRSRRLFWTVNHPTQMLMRELLGRLFEASERVAPALKEADIEETVRVYFPAGELLKIASIPIHPAVARELDLEWYDPHERYGVFGNTYTYEEYFEQMIAFCTIAHKSGGNFAAGTPEVAGALASFERIP